MMEKQGWIDEINGWELTHAYPQVHKELVDRIQIDNSLLDDDYDAIFVLAGGINSDGLVHQWVERRLYASYLFYTNKKTKIVCLGGGSYHIPAICNRDGFIIHESTACAEYLINLGINSKDVYKEWSSYDTIANGYFGFTNHIIPMGLERILIITSDFHMDRSKEIFNWINSLCNDRVVIKYYRVTDDGLDEDLINIRRNREQQSLNNLRVHIIPRIDTLQKLHKWFYEEHKAYCSNAHTLRETVVDEDVKKTY
jgi:hypothetical protein